MVDDPNEASIAPLAYVHHVVSKSCNWRRPAPGGRGGDAGGEGGGVLLLECSVAPRHAGTPVASCSRALPQGQGELQTLFISLSSVSSD